MGILRDIEVNPNELSPLVLAYVGDAAFELLTREEVLRAGNAPVNKLNKRARGIVNAAAQSAMYARLEPVLSERELAVMKRGRNAKSFTVAKNQSVGDYRRATGVEALFGYVYLSGDRQRLIELFNICMDNKENNESI